MSVYVTPAAGPRGDIFGATAGRRSPHRGDDIKSAAGSNVVAARGGVVVISQYSSVLGHTVEIRDDRGNFVGYAHIIPSVRVGQTVKQGQVIGRVAGWGDAHGSAWTGPHLHWTYGKHQGAVFSGAVYNPRDLLAIKAPAPSGGGASGAKWAVNLPPAATQKRIQTALKRRGRYSGPVDGKFGVNTWKGIQITIGRGNGYTGPVDGVPGRNTTVNIQNYAKKFGRYTGPVDGILGPNSWNGFLRGLEA